MQASPSILTVSQLTQTLKNLIEENFSAVWVSGEVSNFHAHSSGHFYFTLKDAKSQISACMFRGANRSLKFNLKDGLEVVVQGRLSIYEPRGSYQIIAEYLEPKGLGALQLAFTQLRDRLLAEGLFAPELKQSLPFFPKNIGIITSPTGAVISDMIHILKRRCPNVNILLYPVCVQGEAAAPEIAAAIAKMNEQVELDLLIVGRGGGSLEDLWAFNTEIVARAIFASRLPIISAVGHETDTTIADYVADLRAPTPSAAAELAVPVLADLRWTVKEQQRQLQQRVAEILAQKSQSLKFWLSHLKHPKKRLAELALRVDDLDNRLCTQIKNILENRRGQLTHLADKLQILSPLATLARGYAIVRKIDAKGQETTVLKTASQVKTGDLILIRLLNDELSAKIL